MPEAYIAISNSHSILKDNYIKRSERYTKFTKYTVKTKEMYSVPTCEMRLHNTQVCR